MKERRSIEAIVVLFESGVMAKQLPEEIRDDILSRMPIKSLVRFRCVSKCWLHLLTSDSHFIKLHSDQLAQPSPSSSKNPTSILAFANGTIPQLYYKPDHANMYEPVAFENPVTSFPFSDRYFVHGVCNGILCFTNSNKSHVYVWNPLTSDLITIPFPDISHRFSSDYYSVSFALGLYPDKVIGLVRNNRVVGEMLLHFRIYTLGSQSWRSLEDITIPIPHQTDLFHPLAPLVNGALHWYVHRPQNTLLVYFDTQDEVFGEMALPDIYQSVLDVHVSEVGGLLCVYSVVGVQDIDMWLMKEYGVVESWTRQFKVRQTDLPGGFTYFKLLGLASNGHILMKTSSPEVCKVILYNPEAETNFIVDYKDFNLKWPVVIPFKPSIASQNSYRWSQVAEHESSEGRTKTDRRREKNKFQFAINSFFKSRCSCMDMW